MFARKKKDLINELKTAFLDMQREEKMIKIMVMSKLLAEHNRTFDDDTLVISITSPGRKQADISGVTYMVSGVSRCTRRFNA